MTLTIVRYEPSTGKIQSIRYEANHDYTPEPDELVYDGPARDLRHSRVDTSTEPPQLVDDPEAEWQRPGVVDAETRELIGQKFRAKGADALEELTAIEANANVSPEVTAYLQDVFAMQYLTYVALTGDRVQSVEDRFFGG